MYTTPLLRIAVREAASAGGLFFARGAPPRPPPPGVGGARRGCPLPRACPAGRRSPAGPRGSTRRARLAKSSQGLRASRAQSHGVAQRVAREGGAHASTRPGWSPGWGAIGARRARQRIASPSAATTSAGTQRRLCPRHRRRRYCRRLRQGVAPGPRVHPVPGTADPLTCTSNIE
jgi:hypothetical protein